MLGPPGSDAAGRGLALHRLRHLRHRGRPHPAVPAAALANHLGLPPEELVEMRVGDKSEYDSEVGEDEPSEIERISLNKAVEELQAKLYATSHFL